MRTKADHQDHELLQAYFKKGDEEAFAELIHRYRGLVCSVVARIVAAGDVDDALQATFLALANHGHRLDASRGLAPWLHRVALRASIDLQRSSKRRQQREAIIGSHGPSSISNQMFDTLDAAIDQLSPKLRRAVIAHYLEARSLEEIAAIEKCSASAISMRLTRASAALRRLLGASVVLTAPLAGPALGSSLPSVDSVLKMVKVQRLAKTTESTSLGLLVKAALKPTWKDLAPPIWSGVGAVASITAGVVLLPSFLAADTQAQTERAPTRPEISSVSVEPDAPSDPYTDPPLIAAIKANPPFLHSQNLVALIGRSGPPGAIRDAYGATPLHWAIRQRAEDYAALLLHHGAGVNSTDQHGRTPLHEAVQAGLESTLFLLLLRGANLEMTDARGLSPLSLAVSQRSIRMAEILLWAGAKPDVSVPAQGEISDLLKAYREADAPTSKAYQSGAPAFVSDPVHEAARKGDFLLLEELIAGSGPGPNARNEKGRTPLHEAISVGREEVVFYLLMMGADPNALDKEGRSPLGSTMYWLGGGLDGNRRHLFARGANPNTIRKDGHSEFTWAALRDNEHGVQWLLWLGVNPHQRSQHGTAFEVAVEEGNQRILDLLGRYGISGDTRLSNDPGWLLHNGAKRADLDLIEEALAKGAPIDLPTAQGDSPLMLAIRKRNVSTAKYLLARGASLNYRNGRNGGSPLSASMMWDFPEMTDFRKEMLEAGADPNIRLANGTTPLMHGIWHHPTTPLKQLIEYGADLNARDHHGRTVLQRAIDEGKLETAAFLRAQGATE